MPKQTIAKLESENLGLFLKAQGLTQKLESTKKRALEQDKEIQKKDVVSKQLSRIAAWTAPEVDIQ